MLCFSLLFHKVRTRFLVNLKINRKDIAIDPAPVGVTAQKGRALALVSLYLWVGIPSKPVSALALLANTLFVSEIPRCLLSYILLHHPGSICVLFIAYDSIKQQLFLRSFKSLSLNVGSPLEYKTVLWHQPSEILHRPGENLPS